MDVLGYEIDIYLVIVVIAGILVFSIVLPMLSSMMPKKHVSKKGKKGRAVLKETLQGEYENKPQKKLSQYPQDKVMEGSQKESSVKTLEKSQGNSSLQIKKLADAEEGAPDKNDEVENPAATTRLWEPEDAQEAKEETEEAESGDLMDVFRDDEVEEDSDLADLAESLLDVDLGTLRKLGEEVTQLLSRSDSGVQKEAWL